MKRKRTRELLEAGWETGATRVEPLPLLPGAPTAEEELEALERHERKLAQAVLFGPAPAEGAIGWAGALQDTRNEIHRRRLVLRR